MLITFRSEELKILSLAKGCSNEQNKNETNSFHRFPFKRPDILELWITAVGRENWYPSKYSRICEDYLHNPSYTRKILKLDAVPSVFNNIPRHSRIMEYQFYKSCI
ncbi:THAP domain-containing protein 1-like [Coccinella septempunctata]|uniref:THAP domain-containing protein 1-like n=1 Tax=Coccinella septempunctata TaxID=41139 RepID=UPI001D098C83|nr:THAP domain-containing protein 1-like [Coccinella septempunctata]